MGANGGFTFMTVLASGSAYDIPKLRPVGSSGLAFDPPSARLCIVDFGASVVALRI